MGCCHSRKDPTESEYANQDNYNCNHPITLKNIQSQKGFDQEQQSNKNGGSITRSSSDPAIRGNINNTQQQNESFQKKYFQASFSYIMNRSLHLSTLQIDDNKYQEVRKSIKQNSASKKSSQLQSQASLKEKEESKAQIVTQNETASTIVILHQQKQLKEEDNANPSVNQSIDITVRQSEEQKENQNNLTNKNNVINDDTLEIIQDQRQQTQDNNTTSQIQQAPVNNTNQEINPIDEKLLQIYDEANLIKDLTPEQLAAYSKFKKYVEDLNLEKKYGCDYLLRFLVARDFILEKTIAMFTAFLEWRKTNDVDNMNGFIFSELKEVRKVYPHGYHHTDKFGRPVYYERLGGLNYQQLFQITTQERFYKYCIQNYENLVQNIFPQCSREAGKLVNKIVTVLDLKDHKLKAQEIQKFLQINAALTKDNYPEILGRMFIINAGPFFNLTWKVLSVFMAEKTREKVKILGTDYLKEILETIDEANLPQYLGGKCTCQMDNCINRNVGCWNKDGKPMYKGDE